MILNKTIPVVLFLFKRVDKPLKILSRISEVRPSKIYLLSDGGRTEDEISKVNECRKTIESAITWDCTVVKRYQDTNIGVHQNIGGGAKWVLDNERWAIFLEDDNLPDLTFFRFCEEMLFKYENDSRILWICGTNYLKEFFPTDGSDYMFSKTMLPCGWASWSNKFGKFYDINLDLWRLNDIKKQIQHEYIYGKLYEQDIYNFDCEIEDFLKFGRFYSWDYHMALSIRANSLFGVVPKFNLITNIGADIDSTHGGSSIDMLMTGRFCEIPTRPLNFPLVHPTCVIQNYDFELLTSKIITDPNFHSLRSKLSRKIKEFFKIPKRESLKTIFYKKRVT